MHVLLTIKFQYVSKTSVVFCTLHTSIAWGAPSLEYQYCVLRIKNQGVGFAPQIDKFSITIAFFGSICTAFLYYDWTFAHTEGCSFCSEGHLHGWLRGFAAH